MRMGIGLGVGINRSNYAQGIFGAYATRVVADGGVVESGSCVDAVSSLLQSASLLLIPSGYKGGKLYAEIPTNGNGDLTWTRGSDAFRTNASGVLQRVPWNLLTNSNDLSQASWSKSNITVTLNSIANPLNGLVNAQTFTPNTTNGLHYAFSNQTTPAGQTYLMSFYVKANGYTNCRVENAANSTGVWFNLSNGTITSGTGGTITALSNGWYFVSVLLTSSGSSTGPLVSFAPSTSLTFAGDGTSGGYVFGAQLVEGTTAQTYLPTTDRLNFPRLSYMYGSCPALLLEPQRTNSIRNSICSGAVTGTPGTYPTNWSATSTGLTQSVVAIGTENGLAYVDLRFNGTANTTLARITPEGPTVISATNSQSWAMSTYAKLISGSYDSSALGFIMRSSVGSNLGLLSQTITLNSTFQRFSYAATTNQASTAFVQPFVDFYVTSGNSYDFTIRIAQPQIELGAYSTTPILTTGSAQATRVADSASKTGISSLIGQTEGVVFIDFIYGGASNESTNLINANRNLVSSFYVIRLTTGAIEAGMAIGGGSVAKITGSSIAVGTRYKLAYAYKSGSSALYINGVQIGTSSDSFTVTQSINEINLNDINSFFSVQRVAFFNSVALFTTRLTNAELATLTT